MSLILRIIRRQQATDKMRRHDHISGKFDASSLPVRETLLQLEARVPVVSILRRGLHVARLISMMTPAQFQPAKNTSGV
jgi:DNA-binding GntR family transcriptional regulator